MKVKNILRLVGINVLVIDSLRNLPIIAHLGRNLFVLYLAAAVVFLIPVACVSRRIAAVGVASAGGGAASIYKFTRMELGAAAATVQELFLWSYNVLWYPTLLIFLASFILPAFQSLPGVPHLSYGLLALMLLLSLLPVVFSSSLSSILAFVGAIIPMLLLTFYALFMIFSHPTHAALQYFVPDIQALKINYIPTVFFSLMGIEIATMHSDLLFSKPSEWNTALWISVVLIIVLLTGCGLAVWELGQGHFLSSLTVSLTHLFAFVPIPHFATVVIVLITLSVLAQAVFWMQATARGIVRALGKGEPGIYKMRIATVVQAVVTFAFMAGILRAHAFKTAFMTISNLSVLLAVFYYFILMTGYAKFCRRERRGQIWVGIGFFGMVVLLVTTVATL